MIYVETLGKIRRRYFVNGETISQIARDFRLTRKTVRKLIKSTDPAPKYVRQHQPQPKLGAFQTVLEDWLKTDSQRPRRERRTAQRLYEGLQREGYTGAYDSVQRFVKHWKAERRPSLTQAFVPLSFLPGAKYQFDWSHEVVVLGGVVQTIKVAHFRLCYSRRMFVAAFPRETQEMIFEAHNRAFTGFGGVPLAGIYDNPKPIVTTVFTGKEREFNRRFLALMNHYRVEPIACTPASGWEKGQVENQVGNVRDVVVHTASGVCRFHRTQCLAGTALPGVGSAFPSGAKRSAHCRGLRGGTSAVATHHRGVRRLFRADRAGLFHLSGGQTFIATACRRSTPGKPHPCAPTPITSAWWQKAGWSPNTPGISGGGD